jgi:hypothetical protein
VRAALSGGSLDAGGDISLVSGSFLSAKTKSRGISGGLVGVGVALSTSTADGSTRTELLGSVTRGKALTVKSVGGQSASSVAFAVTGGGEAGTGASATAKVRDDDDGTPAVSAVVGDVDVTVDGPLTIEATARPRTHAEATGGAFGYVAVGVSKADAGTDLTVRAKVTAGATLKTGSLTLSAVRELPTGSTSSAHAVAQASSGALVGVNNAEATASSGGNVDATVESGVRLPDGAAGISATSLTRQVAEATGKHGAVVAAGAAQTWATSDVTVTASLGANPVTTTGRTGALTVRAYGEDHNEATTIAGSGGRGGGQRRDGDDEGRLERERDDRRAGGHPCRRRHRLRRSPEPLQALGRLHQRRSGGRQRRDVDRGHQRRDDDDGRRRRRDHRQGPGLHHLRQRLLPHR